MTILIVLLSFLLSACTSAPQSLESLNDYDARYGALVNTVKTKPTLAAVIELRQIFVLANRSKVKTTSEKKLTQAMFNALDENDWPICIESANAALARNYNSLNGHYVAMACNFESGNKTIGQYHESVLNLLLEAIWTTGNGESIETAFHIISDVERNAFIEFHGLETTTQTVINHHNSIYDLMTLNDVHQNDTFDWYFVYAR